MGWFDFFGAKVDVEDSCDHELEDAEPTGEYETVSANVSLQGFNTTFYITYEGTCTKCEEIVTKYAEVERTIEFDDEVDVDELV